MPDENDVPMPFTARQIAIYAAANGHVITVGCQTFVFESIDVLLTELGAYLRDPRRVEQEYRKRYPGMNGPLAPIAPGFPQEAGLAGMGRVGGGLS